MQLQSQSVCRDDTLVGRYLCGSSHLNGCIDWRKKSYTFIWNLWTSLNVFQIRLNDPEMSHACFIQHPIQSQYYFVICKQLSNQIVQLYRNNIQTVFILPIELVIIFMAIGAVAICDGFSIQCAMQFHCRTPNKKADRSYDSTMQQCCKPKKMWNWTRILMEKKFFTMIFNFAFCVLRC